MKQRSLREVASVPQYTLGKKEQSSEENFRAPIDGWMLAGFIISSEKSVSVSRNDEAFYVYLKKVGQRLQREVPHYLFR